MLVPAIIRTLGDARDFEYTDLKGLKKLSTAIDVCLASGCDEFAATAFDSTAQKIADNAQEGDVVLADLRFSTRTKKREDGSAYSVQAVSVLAIDIVAKNN